MWERRGVTSTTTGTSTESHMVRPSNRRTRTRRWSPPAQRSARQHALKQAFLEPYQGYGSITDYEAAATSNYNALQFALNRRALNGLFVGRELHLQQGFDHRVERYDVGAHRSVHQGSRYGPASFDVTRISA